MINPPLSSGVVDPMGNVSIDTPIAGFSAGGGVILPGAASSGTWMNRDQILKAIFDKTNSALKASDAGAPSGSYGTMLDAGQIWKACYDWATNALRVVVVTDPPVVWVGDLDPPQIIQDVFDPVRFAFRIITGLADVAIGSRDTPLLVKAIHASYYHALRADILGAGSGTYGSSLDGDQILGRSISLLKKKLLLVG